MTLLDAKACVDWRDDRSGFDGQWMASGTAAGGAQKFPEAFGQALPVRINFSSVRSETAFRRRSLASDSRTDGSILLQLFQPLNLVELQPTSLLAPPVVGKLRHADQPDRVGMSLGLM